MRRGVLPHSAPRVGACDERASVVAIREFTDPTCPWAFSAEPSRLRLLWLYGEGLRFERRMIVLLTYETAIANRP